MKEKKQKRETKTIKVFKDTHKKLKMYVAKTEANMTEFVSQTIDEKLKT